jgi:murein DD-endopeptidase MepM/ murein hydrolase activator NlpD
MKKWLSLVVGACIIGGVVAVGFALVGCGGISHSPNYNEEQFPTSDAKSRAQIPRLAWPTLSTLNNITLGFGADWVVKKGCDDKWKKHTGIDISAPDRDPKKVVGAPVYAAEQGKVIVVGNDPDWKGWVTIEHIDRNGQKFTTVYWHINPSVRVGQTVKRGQQIGTIANMTSPHLHFGVRNAPYSNVANRGALPATKSCGKDDPQFPEKFENPLLYTKPGNRLESDEDWSE